MTIPHRTRKPTRPRVQRGLIALVPGGVFELILPIWLLTKGFAFPRCD
jgi:hypothetical protein